MTDELRRTFGAGELAEFPIGKNAFGSELVAAMSGWRFGSNSAELQRKGFGLLGGFMLADSADGRAGLRELVDPIFHDMIDDLEPRSPDRSVRRGGRTLASKTLIERLDEDDAAALGIDRDRMHFSILGDLATASEKARRDAPAIAVCEL